VKLIAGPAIGLRSEFGMTMTTKSTDNAEATARPATNCLRVHWLEKRNILASFLLDASEFSLAKDATRSWQLALAGARVTLQLERD
jgi:hypothetical protein